MVVVAGPVHVPVPPVGVGVAVKVLVPPAQKDVGDATTVAVGKAYTCTVLVPVVVHVFESVTSKFNV